MPEIGFLHTGFLVAGAAAAALPILIHMLLRQRARTLEIGSVRFLRSVIRQHTRRRRVRQWLLLALRILALLLLAALFARPLMDRTRLQGLNQEATMLVDSSASMRTRSPRGGSLFEQAWQQARSVIEQLDQNTVVRIALFDAGGVEEISIDELANLPSPSDTATDYTSALNWARDVNALSARPQRIVHLWTDLQQSGLRGRVEGFPPDVELVVHDMGRELMQNVAVDDVQATAVEIRPGRPVTVTVRLRNTSPLPANAIPVSLRLDGPGGKITDQQTVAVSGNQRQSAAFTLNVQTPGLYRGEAKIEYDDDLACDNHRFVAFQVRHPDRLLLVDGQPGRSIYANETYFLEMALRLDVPTTETSSRTYEIERIIWEDGEGFPDLTGFRVIVLANLRRLTDIDLRRLRDYTSAGGRLLVFTGDQTSATEVANMLELDLAPGTIGVVPDNGLLRVTSWDADHPIFQPFADPQHGDLRRLVFRRMHRWKQLDQSAHALMTVADQPLLVERQVGAGRVLWCVTPADRDWSDWPQDRLFVPLIRQMLAYLTDQLTELQSVQTTIVSQSMETAGIIQRGNVTEVRNLDPRESSLMRVSAESFRETLGLPDSEDDQSAEMIAGLPAPRFAQRANEVWPLAMWLLLVVLAAELLLASRVHA